MISSSNGRRILAAIAIVLLPATARGAAILGGAPIERRSVVRTDLALGRQDATRAMAFVPAGVFTQGDGVAHCGVDEREVTLTHNFFLAVTEVTNEQYRTMVQWAYDQGYVTATASTVTDALGSAQELLDLDDADSEITFDPGTETFGLREVDYALTYAYPLGYDPTDHPVKEVTWYGAASYCDWLSLSEGLPMAYSHINWSCGPGGDPYEAIGYRLPTDAEWEYAAQWNDERIYPWGDEDPDCGRTNFYDSLWMGDYCVRWTAAVGSYPSGAQPGFDRLVYDLSGNAWEWTNDWWQCDLGLDAVTDPRGPGSGSARVRRGGSWNFLASYLRVAYRLYNFPSYSYYNIGFRPARSAFP